MSGRRLSTRYLVAVALAFGFYSSSAFADEKKPLIISFNGPAGEAYIGKFIKGIKATASDNGYDIEVYENQFNQAEQDQQVQQVLAAGKKPDVFLWWPSDATAGLARFARSTRPAFPS